MPVQILRYPRRGWISVSFVRPNLLYGNLDTGEFVGLPCTSPVYRILNDLLQSIEAPRIQVYELEGRAVGFRLSSSVAAVLRECFPVQTNILSARQMGPIFRESCSTVFACAMPSTVGRVRAEIVWVGDARCVVSHRPLNTTEGEDFAEITEVNAELRSVQCSVNGGAWDYRPIDIRHAAQYRQLLASGIRKFRVRLNGQQISQAVPCITTLNTKYQTGKVFLVTAEELQRDGFYYNGLFPDEYDLPRGQLYAVDLGDTNSTIRWLVISSVPNDTVTSLASASEPSSFTGLVSEVIKIGKMFRVRLVDETCAFKPLLEFQLEKTPTTNNCPVTVGDKISVTTTHGLVTREQLQIVRPRPSDEIIAVLRQLVEDDETLSSSNKLAEVLLQVLLIVTTHVTPESEVPRYGISTLQPDTVYMEHVNTTEAFQSASFFIPINDINTYS